MFEDQFPLRCVHTASTNLEKFEGFVDRFDPLYQHSDDTELPDQEYCIESIIGTKHRGRAKRYVVEWASGETSLEPESTLREDVPVMLDQYIEKVRAAEAACVVQLDGRTDIERMVSELMRRYKQEGSVEDWLEGVQDEWEAVIGGRCEEVSEEVRDEVLRAGVCMKLRMILESKKDGRRKGRLVGQGFWEDKGVTGAHIDSPVASFAAVRMLLFMSGEVGEEQTVIASGDISKAFLKADEYPEGSEPRYVRFRMYKGGPEHVWRLKGPLYGSRDSPQKWFESFARFMDAVQHMIEEGFEFEGEWNDGAGVQQLLEGTVNKYVQGEDEPCVFVNTTTGMRVVVFVDDIISRGTMAETEKFYAAVQGRYPMRTWSILSPGHPLEHLGFTVTEEVEGGETYRYLSQERDVKQLLSDHNIVVNTTVTCPMPTRSRICKDSELLSVEEATDYRALVGSLSWFAISLRYDIAHSVSRLQQLSQNPTKSAYSEAVRVAAFIGSTSDFKLGGRIISGENSIECHSDSDHAGDKLLGTPSHSGVIILLNGIVVHWRSKKQPKTSVSPAAAEIYACSEAVRELRQIWWIARDLNIVTFGAMVVQVDNNQVISFKYSTCSKSKLRGMISNRWNWVKELKEDKELQVVKVASKNNMADILTKCLENAEFNRQRNQIIAKSSRVIAKISSN